MIYNYLYCPPCSEDPGLFRKLPFFAFLHLISVHKLLRGKMIKWQGAKKWQGDGRWAVCMYIYSFVHYG